MADDSGFATEMLKQREGCAKLARLGDAEPICLWAAWAEGYIKGLGLRLKAAEQPGGLAQRFRAFNEARKAGRE